jgi:sugar lactone lactonase YvrE
MPVLRTLNTQTALYQKVSPFGTNFAPYQQTVDWSGWGESIVKDDSGNIWASQGGAPAFKTAGNHSRLVRFTPGQADDPSTYWNDAMCMVDVPGDDNLVAGLAWDSTHHKIWFAEYSSTGDSKLSSFDPSQVPCDNFLDYSNPTAVANAAVQYCSATVTSNCITTMDMPSSTWGKLAHVEVDSHGIVWFTQYVASNQTINGTTYTNGAIGRYDPSTGDLKRFPTPTPISSNAFGSGAWQLKVAPDGSYVYATEFFDNDIIRFNASRVNDPQCLQPIELQTTPCVQEAHVPKHTSDTVHSLQLQGNTLWFTIESPPNSIDDPNEPGFGSIDISSWNAGPPQGTLYTGVDSLVPAARRSAGSSSFAGLAIDPADNSIVFADYLRRQLVRLHPNHP